jgi:glycosyltransferase involved in cell wall biosynthesis
MGQCTVSVIICTCNRSPSLKETVSSIVPVAARSRASTEILVVDNAEEQDAADVVSSLAHEHRRVKLRYVAEPQRGKGYAYNCGMAAAQGELFLWTDDDVRVPDGWIDAMSAPILAGRADAVAGGVRLAPHLMRPWMTATHRDYMSSTELLPSDYPPFMVGANMAFSRTVLTKVPAFDPELGPGALGFYDEALFAYQLREAGFRLLSAFDVEVEHHFDVRALRRNRLIQRIVAMGRSHAYVDYHWNHIVVPDVQRELRKVLLQLAQYRLRHLPAMFWKEGCVDSEIDLVERAAYMRQFAKEAVRPRQYEYHGLRKHVL